MVKASSMEKQATITPHLQFVNSRWPKKAKELLPTKKNLAEWQLKLGSSGCHWSLKLNKPELFSVTPMKSSAIRTKKHECTG